MEVDSEEVDAEEYEEAVEGELLEEGENEVEYEEELL